MTNRREFLRTGVSVSALPLANGLLSPNASARTGENSKTLHKAIFDDRYTECRTFAKTIGRFGVRPHALKNGDVTDLWAGELDRLRGRPAAIAGLTQFGPMFVFEQIAREQRMRVRLRVEHRVQSDGTIAHVTTGPEETLAFAERLRTRVADWPALMAMLLTRCCSDASIPAERTIVMPGARPRLRQAVSSGAPAPESVIHYYTPQGIREGRGVPWDGPLFSWVIAPDATMPRGAESPRESGFMNVRPEDS